MYIMDWVGSPLCELCQDWQLKNGGPYEPSGITRAQRRLSMLFPQLQSGEGMEEAADGPLRMIAKFLIEWHEP